MVVCSTSVGLVKPLIACRLVLYIVTVQTSPSICKCTSTSLLLFPCLLHSFWLLYYWWEDWWCCQQGGYSGFPIWLCHAFFTSESQNSMLTKKERKKERWLWCCTVVNYGVATSLSWSKSICNLKRCLTRIRGASKTNASFERWTPWTGADS